MFNLSIMVAINLTTGDFLDITLNLNMGKYCPYRKPNEKKKQYISIRAPHHIVIRKLVSDISKLADTEIFHRAPPHH